MNEDALNLASGESKATSWSRHFSRACAFALDTNPNLLLGLRTELTSARVPTAPPLPLSVSPRLLFLFRDEAEGVASSYIFVTVVADAASAERKFPHSCANIGACAFTASDSDNASSAVGPRENGSVPALAKTSAANLRTNTPDGKISNSSSASLPGLTPNGNASGEIESILRTSTMDFSISPLWNHSSANAYAFAKSKIYSGVSTDASLLMLLLLLLLLLLFAAVG